MENISGEFLLLFITLLLQIIGTFSGFSRMRSEMSERIARLETHIEHLLGKKTPIK